MTRLDLTLHDTIQQDVHAVRYISELITKCLHVSRSLLDLPSIALQVSQELAAAFKQAQADEGVRALKVVIDNGEDIFDTAYASPSDLDMTPGHDWDSAVSSPQNSLLHRRHSHQRARRKMTSTQ